mgnify:CR=1 FL=1
MTKLTIPQKLCSVMKDIHRIDKDSYNDYHKFDYASESAVKDYLRPKLAEVGLMIIPEVVSAKRTDKLTDLVMQFTIIDIETGETLGPYQWAATGHDTNDKGTFKAETGGYKYFLLNLFLVSTGDNDPDGDTDKGKGKNRRPAPKREQKTSVSESAAKAQSKYIEHFGSKEKAFAEMKSTTGKDKTKDYTQADIEKLRKRMKELKGQK